MFFRSKTGNEAAKPEPGPAQPDEASTADAAAVDAAVSAAAPAPAPEKALPPEELKRRAELSRRQSTAIGEIFTLMLRSPRHRDRKLSDLRWLALPAVRTGQYALVQAQSRSHGLTSPVAAVLWASVSAEVDKRLSETPDQPVRLAPREWRSGDILWLVDAIGEDRGIAALVQRLRVGEWKDRPVKTRTADAQGGVKVRLLEPLPPGNDAAPGSAPAS